MLVGRDEIPNQYAGADNRQYRYTGCSISGHKGRDISGLPATGEQSNICTGDCQHETTGGSIPGVPAPGRQNRVCPNTRLFRHAGPDCSSNRSVAPKPHHGRPPDGYPAADYRRHLDDGRS